MLEGADLEDLEFQGKFTCLTAENAKYTVLSIHTVREILNTEFNELHCALFFNMLRYCLLSVQAGDTIG